MCGVRERQLALWIAEAPASAPPLDAAAKKSASLRSRTPHYAAGRPRCAAPFTAS